MLEGAMDLILSPQSSCVEALTPNVIKFEDRIFRR